MLFQKKNCSGQFSRGALWDIIAVIFNTLAMALLLIKEGGGKLRMFGVTSTTAQSVVLFSGQIPMSGAPNNQAMVDQQKNETVVPISKLTDVVGKFAKKSNRPTQHVRSRPHRPNRRYYQRVIGSN